MLPPSVNRFRRDESRCEFFLRGERPQTHLQCSALDPKGPVKLSGICQKGDLAGESPVIPSISSLVFPGLRHLGLDGHLIDGPFRSNVSERSLGTNGFYITSNGQRKNRPVSLAIEQANSPIRYRLSARVLRAFLYHLNPKHESA